MAAMATAVGVPILGVGTGGAELVVLLRDGTPRTRAELGQLTGLARSTVTARIEDLLTRRLVIPVGEALSTGGRPPTVFTFNSTAHLVLAADLGATHCRLAVTDLAGTLVAERTADLDIAVGPEQVLGWLEDELCDLVRTSGHDLREVRGLGVGLPGPVEHGTGRPVNPPIMPGWDGYGVIERLQQQFAMPVLVDNDVNIMALGEHHVARSELRHLMFVKVGTGIGSGLISEGRLHRGAQGAAGDIGHIRLAHADDVVCRCGNVGCLEAVAGGGALADRLRRAGHEARTARDVVRLATSGNAEAVRLLRQAGRDLGEVLAATVSMVNPDAIVVGGDLAETGDQLLAGVREVVYRRSLPLATQHLSVLPSQLGDRAGVVGAATMVVDHVLSPDVLATAFSAGR